MKLAIFNIHDVFIIVTVVQCLLLALFQVFLPGKNRLSRTLLGLFFLDIGLSALTVLLFWSNHLVLPQPISRYVLPPLLVTGLLLKGPLLYVYVLSLTTKHFRFSLLSLLHLLPLMVCGCMLVVLHIDSWQLKFRAGNSDIRFIWHVVKVLPPLYALAALYKIHVYHLHLKQQYSSFNPLGPAWLYALVLGFVVNWVWSAAVHFAGSHLTPAVLDPFGIADNYITLALIIAAYINSLKYSDKLLAARVESTRPHKTPLETHNTLQKIIHAMSVDKLYLDHRLTIESFSDNIQRPYREVSAVINKELNTNFFEYVNSFRIEEAKILLARTDKQNATILDILLEAGFNSRSSFHRCWNRNVDISPTAFRKRALC